MRVDKSKEESYQLLGVAIDKTSLEDATYCAMAAIDDKCDQMTFACANPHSLVVAQNDHDFMTALNSMDLLVADGAGIIIGSRISSIQSGPRISGHDFFYAIMNTLQSRGGGRVFFFGSTTHVLNLISERLRKEFPAIDLCGTLSPPFGGWSDDQNDNMIKAINDANPDVLWVGMTAPKQEKWVHQNIGKLNARVVGSIGAVFDFYAGTHPRAPNWMCTTGLEWLYRLMREPRRMWKRNFISTPIFLYSVLMNRFYK